MHRRTKRSPSATSKSQLLVWGKGITGTGDFDNLAKVAFALAYEREFLVLISNIISGWLRLFIIDPNRVFRQARRP
jgi:hypothetical protein